MRGAGGGRIVNFADWLVRSGRPRDTGFTPYYVAKAGVVALTESLVLELFNIFNADASDIDHFYTSRLPGEASGGVEDIHTHPAPPRSARIGLQLLF